MKEEAVDRTMWRNRFGGGFGPVVSRILNDDDDDDVFISLLYLFRATQCSSSGKSNCINTSSGIYHSV